MTTAQLKKKQTNYFFSPIRLSILHLFSDLEQVLVGLFLHKLDTDDAILTEAYGIAKKISSKLEIGITTKLYDSFLDGQRKDNQKYVVWESLCRLHKANYNTQLFVTELLRRGGDDNNQSKVEGIHNECLAVKLKVIQNLIINIKDLNQEDTIIEYASTFNFKRSACPKVGRIQYLKKLFFIYGKQYIHEVRNEAKGSLKEYINCTENQLVAKFNSMC